jgi:hypothetical protein
MPYTAELLRKALDVVLQHWMVPNLGWYPHELERTLPDLRQNIAELRSKDLDCAIINVSAFMDSLSSDGFFIAKDWLEHLRASRESIVPWPSLRAMIPAVSCIRN